jgi:preprotein translocase subunit SecD
LLQAQTPKGHPPSAAEMNQAWTILQARVNGNGSSGAQVVPEGGDLMDISIPGTGPRQQQLINLVSTTAQLRFRPVLLFQPYGSHAAASGDAGLVNSATMRLFSKLVCTPGPNDAWKTTVGYTPQLDQWDATGSQIVSCDSSGNKYVLATAVFQGTDVTSENVGQLPGTTGWAVTMTLDGAATRAFGALTTRQYNDYAPYAGTNEDDAVLDQTAMVLDGDVVSSSQPQGALTTGQVEISGPAAAPFTQQQASRLVDEIKYGALPLSFTQVYRDTISPQVAGTSLHAGLTAAGIGFGLVAAYTFVYYRGLGGVAVSSLAIAALLAFLSVVLLSRYSDFTLELSGIAGLAVAIGITADSFVVFFERLRDEVRDGRKLRPAVEHGWKRARRTILVSDTISFLSAIVLYHFAIGEVQGFAYTLGLVTLIDVLVVFCFTRPMVTLLAGTKFFGGGHRWSGLDPVRLGARPSGPSEPRPPRPTGVDGT